MSHFAGSYREAAIQGLMPARADVARERTHKAIPCSMSLVPYCFCNDRFWCGSF